MTHVPKLWCAFCDCEMRPFRNGVVLEALREAGESYYKVAADTWACPRCGTAVHSTPNGSIPTPSYEADYDADDADRTVEFDGRYASDDLVAVAGFAARRRRQTPVPAPEAKL